MKNVLLLLSLLSFSFVISQETEEYPKMTFEQTTINYGKVTPESSGRRAFIFTNTGKAPLIIQKVKGSCGCVVLNFPKKPIMPNEKDSINIVYNVLKIGRISRTVTVTANTKKPITVLKIKGKVVKK